MQTFIWIDIKFDRNIRINASKVIDILISRIEKDYVTMCYIFFPNIFIRFFCLICGKKNAKFCFVVFLINFTIIWRVYKLFKTKSPRINIQYSSIVFFQVTIGRHSAKLWAWGTVEMFRSEDSSEDWGIEGWRVR